MKNPDREIDNQDPMFTHRDSLAALNTHVPLREKLVVAHQSIKKKFPFIARIAITLYDSETKLLKTYLHSSGDDNPLKNYHALLNEAPSLKEILKQGRPRVINRMVTFDSGKSEHTQRIGRQGYAASYTMPMFSNGNFVGFLFFNSYERDVFDEKTLSEIDVYGHLVSLMVVNEITALKTMGAALETARNITHKRDYETGSHLDRMSRYSWLIAKKLADKYDLDDAYIEHIFMFAPLHDIGKIAIPDKILLKPDKLNDEERKIMKTHARIGREMIDSLIENFGFGNEPDMDILRNISEFHHEAVNGQGYPMGMCGGDIPLEARIVAVADVFDALTTRRSYKAAWTNDDAFKMLEKMADQQLDRDCVNALRINRIQVEEIQQSFAEDSFG